MNVEINIKIKIYVIPIKLEEHHIVKKSTVNYVECNRDIPIKNNDSINYFND